MVRKNEILNIYLSIRRKFGIDRIFKIGSHEKGKIDIK